MLTLAYDPDALARAARVLHSGAMPYDLARLGVIALRSAEGEQ